MDSILVPQIPPKFAEIAFGREIVANAFRRSHSVNTAWYGEQFDLDNWPAARLTGVRRWDGQGRVLLGGARAI